MEYAHFRYWPGRLPKTLAYPATGIHHNLAVSARRYPARPFLEFYGATLTYRAALDESERLAGFLQQDCGLQKGDRVLLDMQNSPQFVLAYYAILRAGGMVVPANPMYKTGELGHLIDDSGAVIAVVGQEVFAELAPLVGLGSLRHAVVATYSDYLPEAVDLPMPDVIRAPQTVVSGPGVTYWGDALAMNRTPAADTTEPSDWCVLPYTSGSTGKPKGCIHTHATVMATTVGGALWKSATPMSVILGTAPMFHVTGMQHSMNLAVYAGASLVILPRWDASVAAALIERYRCTHWDAVPAMVIDVLVDPKSVDRDLSSMLMIGGGGVSMPEAMAQKLVERCGIPFLESYGMTETISQTHYNPPDRAKKQCIGIPHFGVESLIVDPESGKPVPTGESGEIVIRGPQLLVGYWKNDAAFAESWIEIDGRSFFRTGDLGRVDEDGYFFITDRLKRMINAAGYKVWPAEIEAMMYHHPAVRECCVIGAPDERRGETVKAVVVLREGVTDVTAEALIEWARSQMAVYKAPRIVEFVDEIPRGGTGKVMWRELQEKAFGRGKA
ncbi:fatty-acyl-CoA synthase [Paraburkholderia sp. BL27I4N3]|uniref:long-chain-fatty-acid--CoA ligase n=1 Tax=Paraburkholderia sp. BL27I4N3 TaxID=1938805 RepID=UPI000E25796A|nr:long-chain-fatty-acid--CoA ligase [Paraburkholderia sp. BL27I4N3]REE07099.1 fatty-acyl-CoA synthase [Paraburkholderia sp. BL27I4N3]